MTLSTPSHRTGLFAVLGAALSLPALLLFLSGMIQYATGAEALLLPSVLLHPVVLLGGLLLAFGLNAFATLSLHRHADAVGYAFTLRVVRRPGNLLVLGLAAFLLSAILAYGFVEKVLAAHP